jgi:hypothetical protein
MEIRRISRRLMRSHTSGMDEGEPPFDGANPGEQQRPSVDGTFAARAVSGFVRPLAEEDLDRIVELHRGILPGAGQLPAGTLRERLSQLLLGHPWRSPHLQSLVYQETGGRIAGCIGIMPRPMVFQGRPVTAAISHSFIVEPGARPMLAALELAQNFLAGPQDLSLAEAGRV